MFHSFTLNSYVVLNVLKLKKLETNREKLLMEIVAYFSRLSLKNVIITECKYNFKMSKYTKQIK